MNVRSSPWTLRRLEWDTRHFGRPMGHVILPTDLPPQEVAAFVPEIVEEAVRAGLEHLTVRVAPTQVEVIHALERAGFRLMDTLVTLELDLQQYPPEPEPPRSLYSREIRPAIPEDQVSLTAIARHAFADCEVWLDRFHADPQLHKDGRADALYVQWVKNSVAPEAPSERMADHTIVAGPDGRTIMGFITCVKGTATAPAKVSLNAVDKIARQHGVYRLLVHHALKWFQEQGEGRVTIRTSVTSQAVQRTWIRQGAVPVHVEHTFHWWVEDAR